MVPQMREEHKTIEIIIEVTMIEITLITIIVIRDITTKTNLIDMEAGTTVIDSKENNTTPNKRSTSNSMISLSTRMSLKRRITMMRVRTMKVRLSN
jgi:hypothetical protein